MAVWTCADCTARYAVGAPRCPQCGCKVRVDDGSEDDMAKVTVHGGPSDVHTEERGEDVSAGTSSSTSSAKEQPSPETSETGTRKRAQKTGSRSGRARTDSSSARSADGGPAAGTSVTNSADEEGDA